jgi:HD superfamily phosphohydrolase/uncharacterized protein YjbK
MKWDEKPIKFRDPVQGYISVPRIYVTGLIDTPYVQRIKGISQTGIRPVYPSATHDRFTHSLGVYRFSMMAYDSLKLHVLKDVENSEHLKSGNLEEYEKIPKNRHNKYQKSLKWDLEFWRVLLSIAALLHDVGHPAFSHSFEFLYDDIFMVFPDDECPEGMEGIFPPDAINMRDKNEYSKWRKLNEDRQNNFDNLLKSPYDESTLKKKLFKYFDLPKLEDVSGKPHERMGAYMIFSGIKDKNGGGSLYDSVKTVIQAYLAGPGSDKPEEYYSINNYNNDDDLIKDSINFVCRMITGQTYSPPYNSGFIFKNYRKSAQDCIIQILNGTVDVDSIDYTMRNAHSAGYDTHKVDYDRLCSSFSVYFERNILKPCFSSAAISVLDGFIMARNTEPTWLYSHHKVVYHDVLIKMLFRYASKYLSYLDSVNHEDKPAANKERKTYVNILDEENKKINMTDNIKEELSEHLYCPYGIYMISPLIPFMGSKHIMNMSTDASFDALFKSIDIELSHEEPLDEYKFIYSQKDHEIFKNLIKEYINRKYKRSLWKSYPEYMVFIKQVARKVGIPYEYVHRYMVELVEEHLVEKCFNIIDSSGDTKKITDSYKEQYTYVYYNNREESYYDKKYPSMVFGDEHGLFTYPNCVCKIFNPRFKKGFDELAIDFGDNKRIKLGELSHGIYFNMMDFPYIFITFDDKKEKANSGEESEKKIKTFTDVKNLFWSRFEEYCNKRIREDALPVCEEGLKLDGEHGFRDVVHGDITFPDKFWNIINTPEFQRLLRIKQLALTSLVFPTINHTRYEHSIGTCHIMRQVVEHFDKIFKKHGIVIHSDDSKIAILAALLHDIGHGPFSHAFEDEKVMNLSHEKWTERIIIESDKLNKAIRENFGEKAPERVVACLNHKNISKTDSYENLNFSLIYSTLVSGALDVDRIDYLLRDGYYTAAKFGSIDISKIISAINLTSIDGKYRLCFDRNYLSYLEQMIFARKEMYINVYFNMHKVMMETIVQKIIQRAYLRRDKLLSADREFLEKLKDNRMRVEEYLSLDDYMMYDCFKRWREERKDTILSELCASILDKNDYTSALDVSSNGTERENLLNEIEEQFGLKLEGDTPESFAIFKEDKNLTIYPDPEIKDEEAKTILISNQNGEVEDFGNIVNFNKTKISCNYLFWSEKVLEHALIERGYSKEDVMRKVKEVKKLIESYKPRNHIEIERKYLCSSDTLGFIKKTLGSNEFDSFDLDESFEEKEQIDTYFDTENYMLLEKNCTLRIRRLKNSFVCTVKLPVKSESFGRNSPTARREYEIELSKKPEDKDNIIKLFESQKKFILKRLGKDIIKEENFSKLQPILDIKNKREKGVVKKKDSTFECEVCLDNVTYSKPGEKAGKNDWQIEVELKSEYLTHVILDQFTMRLEELMKENSKEFKSTGISKLERGLKL